MWERHRRSDDYTRNLLLAGVLMTAPLWQTVPPSSEATCLPCCEEATGCSCALLIPPLAAPYIDYATADGVITDPLLVHCLAYNDVSANMSSFGVTWDGTTFVASGAFSTTVSSFGYIWISASAKAGATFTFACTGGSNVAVYVYDCNGTEIEVIEGATPQTSAALAADGEYYIKVLPNTPPPGGGFTAATATITSSDVWWVNPVIALWDDSGTTRELEACPKFILPLFAEGTGTWYADCAAADAMLTDPLQVSNCVGVYQSPAEPGVDTFSASSGGSSVSLTVSDSTAGGFSATGLMYGCINAEAGETISVNCSSDGGTFDIGAALYDMNGSLIENFSTVASSSAATSPLPYTGKYYVGFSASIPPPGTPPTTLTGTISASGTATVNEIQALYDAGMTCPARLDCGDACP